MGIKLTLLVECLGFDVVARSWVVANWLLGNGYTFNLFTLCTPANKGATQTGRLCTTFCQILQLLSAKLNKFTFLSQSAYHQTHSEPLQALTQNEIADNAMATSLLVTIWGVEDWPSSAASPTWTSLWDQTKICFCSSTPEASLPFYSWLS